MTPLRDVNATSTATHQHRPRRSGEPWSDEDYEHLVALVREGHEVAAIADALGRTPGGVRPRLRALLPPEQRAILADRVLPTLRALVSEQPDYPWAEIMVQLPPPAPVIQQVVNREGVAGLEDDVLLEVTWAMLHCETADEAHLHAICREVASRRLIHEVTHRLATALVRRLPPVTPDEASYAAHARFDLACGNERLTERDVYDPYPYERRW